MPTEGDVQSFARFASARCLGEQLNVTRRKQRASAGNTYTYTYTIALNDGSTITFQYGLR